MPLCSAPMPRLATDAAMFFTCVHGRTLLWSMWQGRSSSLVMTGLRDRCRLRRAIMIRIRPCRYHSRIVNAPQHAQSQMRYQPRALPAMTKAGWKLLGRDRQEDADCGKVAHQGSQAAKARPAEGIAAPSTPLQAHASPPPRQPSCQQLRRLRRALLLLLPAWLCCCMLAGRVAVVARAMVAHWEPDAMGPIHWAHHGASLVLAVRQLRRGRLALPLPESPRSRCEVHDLA